MVDFETSYLRDLTVQATPEADFESSLIFYYDETNNIRKFHIKEAKFNSSFTSNFVLGGLVYERPQSEIASLFDGLQLQSNIKEVKFCHIAKNGFIDCLKSRHLTYFLEYLLNNDDVYVHFSSFNFLYWSIVDIIDSAIETSSHQIEIIVANDLKDVLYQIIKIEFKAALRIFHKFNYPNLKKSEISDFLSSLVILIDKHVDRQDFSPGLWLLKEVFEEAKRNQSLSLLVDNENHMLLDGFLDFYLRPIYLFKNSVHNFDYEAAIVKVVEDYKIVNRDEEVRNYSFINSKDSQYIQASDIFVGLMGKFEHYRNSSSINDIKDDFRSLSKKQLNTVNLFFDLIAKSRKKNVGFLFSLDSHRERMKIDLIDNIRTQE